MTRLEWLYEFEERAAIFEYLGGFNRAAAESRARTAVGPEPLDLQPAPPAAKPAPKRKR